MQRLVSRALAVRPEDRYQTIGELLAELQALRQSREPRAAPGRLLGRVLLFTLLVLGAGAAGLWGWYKLRTRKPAFPPAPTTTLLIATGNATEAAISPDGRHIAYTTGRGVSRMLWLREVATGADTQLLTAPAGQEFQAPVISPVTNEIFFLVYDASNDARALYCLPMRGGAPRRVLDGIESPVAFAPDGQRFAAVRYERSRRQSALILAQNDGSSERTLAVRTVPFRLASGSPAWSPDGRRLIYAAGTDGEERDHHIYEYSLDRGSERLLSPLPWRRITSLAWLGDHNALALLASDPPNNYFHIWQIALPAGGRRRLSAELGVNSGLSVTADGRTIATVQMQWSPDGRALDYADTINDIGNLWRLPLDGGPARQTKTDVISRFAWSRDGAQLAVSRLIRNWDVILLRDFL